MKFLAWGKNSLGILKCPPINPYVIDAMKLPELYK